jgi:hypothetical protein
MKEFNYKKDESRNMCKMVSQSPSSVLNKISSTKLIPLAVDDSMPDLF